MDKKGLCVSESAIVAMVVTIRKKYRHEVPVQFCGKCLQRSHYHSLQQQRQQQAAAATSAAAQPGEGAGSGFCLAV